ncbi:MAG: hypothetical protein JWO31_2288 [Phycisphaerales bacterium]|nr:hypothetical protein [Phycisphaerales bacterium]
MTTLPQTAPIRVARPMQAGSITVHNGGSIGPVGVGGGGFVPPQGGLTAADVLRVVRANLWLILLAVVAGGVGGYFANEYLKQNFPKYRASGLVVVRSPSEMPDPGKEAPRADTTEIALLQETHCQTLMHESLFVQAMQDKDSQIRSTKWYAGFQREKDPMAAMKQDVQTNLRAAPRRGSRLIEVEMTTADPQDSKVILEELVNKHVDKYAQDQRNAEINSLNLLQIDRKSLQTDLDEGVTKQLAEYGRELGNDQVEISANYNGKRMLMERMLQERSDINSKLAGLKSQMQSLDGDLRDGRTPPEVQSRLSSDGRYLSAQQRVDDIGIELDQLRLKLREDNELIVSVKARKAAYQQNVDSIREQLKSEYAETYKATLKNQINAYEANGNVIDQTTTTLSRDLGSLNDKMQQYRILQQKEQRLRDRIATMDENIRRQTQIRLKSSFSQAEWSSRPQKPDAPSFPKLPLTVGVSVMLGLALSLGIAFLRELTDTTVRSPRDIAKVGQLTLLGLIPHENDDPQAAGSRLPLAILDAPNSHIAEQFRQIRTRLQYAHSLDTTRSVLVTSPSAQDGKTMVACNLAASLALNGRRILLVDANFRRPGLHTVFNAANENGFGETLTDLDRMSDCVRPTDVPNLSLMVAGAKPTNPTELLESQFFVDFVERALDEYDHVIFDAGPLLMASETVAMAPRVDGVLTVVRARGNSRGLLQRLRDDLRRVKAEHLGVILNAVRSRNGGYYSRNIKKYYAYQNA